MLADLFVWINTHYISVLLLMLAGACFVLAGMLGIFIWRRRDVVLGEPDAPTWTEPTVATPLPPKAHYRRDDDTQVIPGIPGALPPETVAVERFIDAVDEATVAIAAMTGVPTEMLAPPGVSAWEAFEQIEGLRVIPSTVHTEPIPVAPPDDCALTTDELEIPTEGVAPIAAEVSAFRNRRQETQDLTVRLDQILERERVA